MKKRFGSSKLQWTLIIGFGLIITIMAFTWYDNRKHIDSLYEIINSSRQASQKMEIIASLIEISRSRTRLTNKMLHTDDPFVKDEIGQDLNVQATKFAVLREKLLNTGLTKEELTILHFQNEAIRPTLQLQRKAADMALSEDPAVVKQAQAILIEDVYMGQGVIIDFFMELLQLQKTTIDAASEKAAKEYRIAAQLEVWLLFITLSLAIFIATVVIRRTGKTEKALFLEKERAQITLKSIGDAVITTDKYGRIEYLNPIAEKITGHFSHNVQGQLITDIFKAYDEINKRWLSECILHFLHTGKFNIPSNDTTLRTKENNKLDIAVTIAPIQTMQSEVLGVIATFQDITKTKSLAKRLEHQARHDPLTGLLNRREFEIKVNQALNLFSENTEHALCVLDLDRFKVVNDTVGHTAGDELLRQLSQRIKMQLRKGDLVARIGGDEFSIFLPNINQENATLIAEDILNTIREFHFYWNKQTFRVGASIGLVDAPPKSSDYAYLFHAADTACYIAKHEGRDRVNVVSIDDKWLTEKREETHWVSKIESALQKGSFILYGQDIVPLKDNDNEPNHKEVLLRMEGVNDDIILPMAFIPAAERYNLMSKIDEWVIKQTLNIISDSNSGSIYNVNLSGQSMGDQKFTKKVTQLITESNIDTSLLCFEITETAAISNLHNAQTFLDELHQLGCKTALDDFGSGLSSFAYLRNLKIDYLKIDGMFIKQITEDPTCRIMVESIHAVSQAMNLLTIAEFVENDAVRRVLQEIGIDYAQGYFYGKPEPLIKSNNVININLAAK
ncbi:MAG: EAL domain-containing protein [Gammaproteobacteria bacterium]|nr:EAL domain-containing protein [Gammaproteobacteria bacterium]